LEKDFKIDKKLIDSFDISDQVKKYKDDKINQKN